MGRARLLSVLLLVWLTAGPSARAAPDTSGRPQALILTTAFGFYEGITLWALLDDADLLPGDPVITGATLTLLTTGGSFAAGWYVTDRYGVNAAQASMITSSFFWTVLNATTVGLEFDLDDDDLLWNSLMSGVTGQGLGILLAANLDSTAGQVSLMNTVGTWTGAEAAIILGLVGEKKAARYLTWSTVAADLGLLAGVYLASKVHISQERARFLDLGAFTGALAAPAALFMVWGPEDNLRTWYLSAAAVGIPLGIATAWHLTRDMDAGPAAGTERSAFMVPLAGGVF